MSRLEGTPPSRPPPLRLLRLLLAGAAGLLFWAWIGGLAYSFVRYGRLPFGADPLLGAREAAVRHDVPAALRQYEMAQTLSPLETRIAIEHGNLLAFTRRFDEAAVQFERALREAPANPAALAGLGDARRGQGRLREAVSLYEQASVIAPDNARLARALATLRQDPKL